MEEFLVISFGPGRLYLISYKSDTVDVEMVEDAFSSYLEGADTADLCCADIIDDVMQSFVVTGELSYRWVSFYHIDAELDYGADTNDSAKESEGEDA